MCAFVHKKTKAKAKTKAKDQTENELNKPNKLCCTLQSRMINESLKPSVILYETIYKV